MKTMKMYRMVKTILCVAFYICCTSLTAQITDAELDTRWRRTFSSAPLLDSVFHSLGETPYSIQIRNNCWFIWNAGDLIIDSAGTCMDASRLLSDIPSINLQDTLVVRFMTEENRAVEFVDRYFMLKAMQRGDCFENARDKLFVTTRFPISVPGRNDSLKLKAVFASSDEQLHRGYLQKLKFVFRTFGYLDMLIPLRTMIETNVADCQEKKEVLALYNRYGTIRKGQKAPIPILKDVKGNNHSLDEFKGSLLVLDIWATWCCSCLEKMPLFLELEKKYHGDNRVRFIAVSIDRENKQKAWKEAIKKHGLEKVLNLCPMSPITSQFEHDYCIDSVPRYLLIDKEGCIITAFAPSPSHGLEDLIKEYLIQ